MAILYKKVWIADTRIRRPIKSEAKGRGGTGKGEELVSLLAGKKAKRTQVKRWRKKEWNNEASDR